MSTDSSSLRFSNPFREATSSELIENPEVYSQIFSQEILVNETLDVFEKNNVVLTGPQGTGKTMILCLFRHPFVSAFLNSTEGEEVLQNIRPYLSISINLIRSGFHVFGRRSPARSFPDSSASDEEINAQGASDVLSNYLLLQFLTYLEFIDSDEGCAVRQWMGIEELDASQLAKQISSWDCWRGYYSRRRSLHGLKQRCQERLEAWHDFLNVNIDTVPKDIWETTPTLEQVVHEMGMLTATLSSSENRDLPLYVVIDQYEVLPELNKVYGSALQRIVNSLIKARDPYVFFKIGARPYDWGKELRVWGAESRIEVDRDYKIVNLTDVLRRGENPKGWLFPAFACDVAYRRLKVLRPEADITTDHVKVMLGKWDAESEAKIYLGNKPRKRMSVVRKLSDKLRNAIEEACQPEESVLQLRLASAWALQQIQNRVSEHSILLMIKEENRPPWEKWSWRKERIEIALHQVAAMTNQRKKFFGWESVLYLSGADIRAFLRICEEIWEFAAKIDPSSLIDKPPISPDIQTEGIFEASHKWRLRDRTETYGGGSLRYAVISRLGPAIHDYLINDFAISNPGHSGFSVREPDLSGSAEARRVAEFLGNGLNWAIFEERTHTSKQKEGSTRSKWFLHPILSPAFGIPLKRVKEPYYTTVDTLYQWFFGGNTIRFGTRRREKKSSGQRELPFGDVE